MRYPSIVHENVQPPAGSLDRFDCRVDTSAHGKIGRQAVDGEVRVGRFKLCQCGLELRAITSDDNDVGAFPHESLGNRKPDAVRPAGHQRQFLLKSHAPLR